MIVVAACDEDDAEDARERPSERPPAPPPTSSAAFRVRAREAGQEDVPAVAVGAVAEAEDLAVGHPEPPRRPPRASTTEDKLFEAVLRSSLTSKATIRSSR